MSAISAGSRFSHPFVSAFINTKPVANIPQPNQQQGEEMHVLKTNTLDMNINNPPAPVWQSNQTKKYPLPTFGMAAYYYTPHSPWYIQGMMATTTTTTPGKITTGPLLIIGMIVLLVVYFAFISKSKKR